MAQLKDRTSHSMTNVFLMPYMYTGRKPAGKGSFQARGSKKNPGRISKNKGMSSRVEQDYVTKRMLSARRIKINELKNEIEDLSSQLTELRTENKMLRRQQTLQARALDRYEVQESDMPQILQKHAEEVRVLREQLRKQKEKYKVANKRLRDTGDELSRTQRLLKKMKGLVEDKKLGERDSLSQKLTKTEADLEEKDMRLKNLDRHIEHLNKNHKHELGIERARHKETQRRLLELEESYERMQISLREKEKELDVRNIYAQRLMKPPHKLSSALNSTASSPAPTFNNRRSRKSSEPSLTPREKAKMFEMKQREEQRRQREDAVSHVHSMPSNIIPTNQEGSSPSKHTTSKPKAEKKMTKPSKVETDSNIIEEEPLNIDLDKESISPTKTNNDLVNVPHGNRPETVEKTGPHGDFQPQPVPKFEPEKSNNQQNKPGENSAGQAHFWELSFTTPSANRPIIPMTQKNAKSHSLRTRSDIDINSSEPTDDEVEASELPAETDQGSGITSNSGKATSKINSDPKSITSTSAAKKKPVTSKAFSITKNRTFNKSSSATALGEKERREQEAAMKEQEQREREWWEKKERERLDQEYKDRQDEAHQEQADEEEERKRWQQEREKRKKEAETAEKLRQEREKRETEQQQKAKEKKEQEEKARKEKEEREREKRDKEERERREREEIERQAQEERDRLANDAAEQERRRQKELLLAKMREIDETKQSSDATFSPSAKRRNYSFTKPVENLHEGKPAYEEVSVPALEKSRRRGFLEDDDSSEGGYQPSFAPSKNNNTRASRNRKSDLMNDLFGSTAKPQPERQDSGLNFGSPKGSKNPPSKRNKQFSSGVATNGLDHSEGDNPSSSQLLPRRTRQQSTTIHSRPTINAIDDIDDDIEEVTL